MISRLCDVEATLEPISLSAERLGVSMRPLRFHQSRMWWFAELGLELMLRRSIAR
jgi:hypothetical protein